MIDPEPPEFGIFSLNKHWILDSNLFMRRQMGVLDFSSSGGKVEEVVKIDRVAVNLAIIGLKIFGLSSSPLRKMGKTPGLLLLPVAGELYAFTP